MRVLTTDDLKQLIDGDSNSYVLDVRSPEEFASGHVAGAINIPHTAIAARLTEVPSDRTIYVHCQMGGRAGMAAKVLAANGRDVACVAPGGMGEWRAKGYPTIRGS